MITRSLAAALLAVPLAGCISFGAEPPDSLLTLTADRPIEPGRTLVAQPGTTVTVLVPTVSQALATQRIPVQTGATNIAYVADAQWVEPPNRLFQRLLSETIQARSGRAVLSPRQFDFAPGVRVTGALTQFGADASSNQVVVSYDATMTRGEEGQPNRVQTRRFEARVPVATIDAASVGQALNQAANQVAGQVSDWVTGGQ